jgi:hypothetical protein
MAMYMYYRTMCILYTTYFLQSIEYTECHAFFPLVGIGSPHPLTRKRVLLPLFGFKGRDTLAFGGSGWGMGVPNSDEGTDTLVLNVRILQSLYAPETACLKLFHLWFCSPNNKHVVLYKRCTGAIKQCLRAINHTESRHSP